MTPRNSVVAFGHNDSALILLSVSLSLSHTHTHTHAHSKVLEKKYKRVTSKIRKPKSLFVVVRTESSASFGLQNVIHSNTLADRFHNKWNTEDERNKHLDKREINISLKKARKTTGYFLLYNLGLYRCGDSEGVEEMEETITPITLPEVTMIMQMTVKEKEVNLL
jgi:hypothetical protein